MKEVGTLKELGVKVGDVLQWSGGEEYPCTVCKITDLSVYINTPNGRVGYSIAYCTHPWEVISRASDKPKTWRDMTPEEKGALLLAAHEGKVIEGRNETWRDDVWITVHAPSWSNNSSYRVKPEPKVETVTQHWKTNRKGEFVPMNQFDKPYDPSHRITFNLIDGKPDCASIKMECIA